MGEYVAYRDGGKTNEEGLHKGQDRFLEGDVPTIHSSTSLKIVQRGAGANMSVDVSIGDGLFDKGDYSFWGWIDAAVNKAVTASDPTNPRIDVVIAYVDLAVVSSASNNNPGALKFAVVAGTPAGSPVAPDTTARQAAAGAGNPYISLASIAVAASATQVVDANITDLRVPISFKGRLYGGSSNTNGHVIPNIADDTVGLLAAVQTFTNKTIGTGNSVSASALVSGATAHGFLEIGRTTLGVAGDSLSVTFPARKWLRVTIVLIPTGGTISAGATFNGDTGNNYSSRFSVNNGADSTATSSPNFGFMAATTAELALVVADIINILAQEKLVHVHSLQGPAGAATAPGRLDQQAKWANTAAQITTITVSNVGTGDYAIGSEIVVQGHD